MELTETLYKSIIKIGNETIMFKKNDEEHRTAFAKKVAELFETSNQEIPKIVCDETNNTKEILEKRQMVIDIDNCKITCGSKHSFEV